MERVTMSVNGTPYMLAQGQNAQQIKNDVAAAARDGAEFITVSVFGNRSLDVLVTPGVPITFESESESVDFDARDDGDLNTPFDTSDFDDYHLGH
jgi:hypothetical protein